MTKNQLKEQIRKIIKQQLREQIEEPYPKAVQAINNWFEQKEKSGKLQKNMLDYAIEALSENAEPDYKWIPDEQEAVQTMFDKFDSYWLEELLEDVADDFRDIGLDEIIENDEELIKKAEQHTMRICERYAKEMFDAAADQLDEDSMDPYKLRGLSRRDFY